MAILILSKGTTLMLKNIEKEIGNAVKVVAGAVKLKKQINSAVNLIAGRMLLGGKLVLFGNGGSAADAQHVAAEFVGRFNLERKGFPAIALTVDTSILTSIANDYGFEQVFSRQVQALVCEKDIVIAISTSGNSPNVLRGIEEAKRRGAKVIGFTGKTGGKMAKLSDILMNVNSADTWHVQEAHIVILHTICKLTEGILNEQK